MSDYVFFAFPDDPDTCSFCEYTRAQHLQAGDGVLVCPDAPLAWPPDLTE